MDSKKEVLPYIVLVFLFIFKLPFFQKSKNATKKIPMLKIWIFVSRFNLKIEGWILSSIILDYNLEKICSCRQSFFCKHLDLVISQLLDKIFQPFKEQKWCPSLGAPNFGVNSECFAQLLRIRSKTPNFGVTKNSDDNQLFLNLLLMLQVCSLVDKSRPPFSWVYYCWVFMAMNL